MGKIDCRAIAQDIRGRIAFYIGGLPSSPGLAILQVGDEDASNLYIKQKIKVAESLGIHVVYSTVGPRPSELNSAIDEYNSHSGIHGIIIQLPLPWTFDENEFVTKIRPEKDVDGFHPLNLGKMTRKTDDPYLHPCTAWGIAHLLKRQYPNGLRGKKVLVIGQSMIVGRPLSIMLQNEGACVTMADEYTESFDIYQGLDSAEIVVTATGVPGLINSDLLTGLDCSSKCFVDAGISLQNGEVVGDINKEIHEEFEVGSYTPVPGGIGPITVAFLMRNVLKAYCIQNRLPIPKDFG